MARIAKPAVAAVAPGSAAERAGIQPGDRLVEINGQPVRDELDYRFLTADESLELKIVGTAGTARTVTVTKEFDDELGVDFGGKATFDGIYTCHNNCVFCFVHQQPRGLRPTLTLMDDDFRLSYLHGNFITLVGITTDHWQRILDQKLTPLYISVHATDDDLRAFLLGTDQARGIMRQLQELAIHGIQFHTQVVACPGMNDGPQLDRTIRDLTSLGPDALLSISVVPVGLTRYRQGLYPVRSYLPPEADIMLDKVARWQAELESEWGFPVVYASDEWYVVAEREVPPAEHYGSYDQLENGVGMIRLFLEQMADVTSRLPASLSAPRKVTVATGLLAMPTLERAARWLTGGVDNLQVDTVTILNEFYGHSVTVAGLLMAQDFISQLKQRESLGDLVILPAVAFREMDQRSLDNITVPEISTALGVPVRLAASPAELADAATGGQLLPERKRRTHSLRFRHQGEAGAVNLPRPTEDKDPMGVCVRSPGLRSPLGE